MDINTNVKCKDCRFAEKAKHKVCYCNYNKHIMDATKVRECLAYSSKK